MAPVSKPTHQRSPTFLRQWRRFKKLSQEKAADRVDVDRTTLGRIEKGELPYNQDFLEKLATAYGCEVPDLLSVDPTAPRETDVIRLFRASSPQVQLIIETILKTGTGG